MCFEGRIDYRARGCSYNRLRAWIDMYVVAEILGGEENRETAAHNK